MDLNDLLTKTGIEPKSVLVLRHRPSEPELRKVLPWLAAEKPEVYNGYQQAQWPKIERAMTRAKYVASFIGHEPRKALFIGLYDLRGWKSVSFGEFWRIPANIALKSFGMTGLTDRQSSRLWFDLRTNGSYSEWKGKLIVHWPGLERSWWRWADRNTISVAAILQDSLLDEEMKPWNEVAITWSALKFLPTKWRAALSQWRGIYLIIDVSDGKSYVGSAYGGDNLLGRWLNYASSRHGGNSQLRKRSPDNFRFSILELVSPNMEMVDVIRLESLWKDRLHTRTFGLNDN